jgi:small subunit ribosomal protein S20
MAHHKSALKRIRQTRTRKLYNRGNRKLMREAVKAVRLATDPGTARELLHKAYSILDRVTARGIIHKNAAANRKSSLAAHVRKLEQK